VQQGHSVPPIQHLFSVAFRKHWDHDLLLQVDVIEDEAAGKRTIRTTTICWGNKLSLLVSTPFYDPRLPANANDPDLDFSQAQIELNTEADWQKVPLHAQYPPAANHQLHLLEPDCLALHHAIYHTLNETVFLWLCLVHVNLAPSAASLIDTTTHNIDQYHCNSWICITLIAVHC